MRRCAVLQMCKLHVIDNRAFDLGFGISDVQFRIFHYCHAELVSASHMLSNPHAVYLSCRILKQVQDDGGVFCRVLLLRWVRGGYGVSNINFSLTWAFPAIQRTALYAHTPAMH